MEAEVALDARVLNIANDADVQVAVIVTNRGEAIIRVPTSGYMLGATAIGTIGTISVDFTFMPVFLQRETVPSESELHIVLLQKDESALVRVRGIDFSLFRSHSALKLRYRVDPRLAERYKLLRVDSTIDVEDRYSRRPGEPESNRPPQSNADRRPTSNASPAFKTPSSLGRRG
jgi:hypothetical protein